jgi:hypothetical protein
MGLWAAPILLLALCLGDGAQGRLRQQLEEKNGLGGSMEVAVHSLLSLQKASPSGGGKVRAASAGSTALQKGDSSSDEDVPNTEFRPPPGYNARRRPAAGGAASSPPTDVFIDLDINQLYGIDPMLGTASLEARLELKVRGEWPFSPELRPC